MSVGEIIDLVKGHDFIIYGNGFIAKRFLNKIRLMGFESHVSGVAVSKVSVNEIGINGWQVMSIDEVDRSSLVFIAAHDDAALEMEKYARALGFTRVISIYHHLFDIEVGEPVQRNISVKVSKLIKNLHSGCLPAVYYFSLCDYLGHNKYNGAIYKKTYMHFTSFKSAEQRWNRFKDRIYQFENKGFFQDYNVKITKDYCLMDGLHRLILAKYYNVDALSCDVYDCDASYFSNNIFSQDVLIQKRFRKVLYSR